jgi:eukaryotic-like serine/threonine-protein kinase
MSAGFTQSSDGSEFTVKIGEVLGGKYRVDRIIGEGGMGFVVAATHIHLEDQVAIKLLLPDAVKSPDVVKRFLSEARTAKKIKSEHVARVTDVGTLDSGAPFMVMEYLAGSDLADVIEKTGPMPIETSVELILQACEALAEAHAADIVHRDLKPANLFLTRRADGSPCVKVLDFGISKIADGSHAKTKTSAVMGSPAYMSPEQMRSSKDVDARTDIWALGAILYELLAGVPPFDAETVPQLCMKIMTEPLPPLAAVRRDVPPGLEAVIRRCQEKDANGRYRHIGELAEALAPFAVGRARFSVDRVAEIARTSGLASRVSAIPSHPPIAPQMTIAGAPLGIGTAATMAAAPMGVGGVAGVSMAAGATGSTSGMWSGSVEPARVEAAPKKKSAPIAAAIAAVAVGLVAVGVIAFVALRGGGGEPTAQGTGPASTVIATPQEKGAGALGPAVTVASDPPPSVDAQSAETAPTSEPATKPAVEQARPTIPTGPAKPATKPTTKPSIPPPTKPGNDLFNDRK